MPFNDRCLSLPRVSSLKEREIPPLLNILTVGENKRKLGRIENLINARFFIEYCKKSNLKYYHHISKKLRYLPFFFAKKESYIKRALRYHCFDDYRGNITDSNIVLGHLYGYPDCCIKIFIDNIKLMNQDKNFQLRMKILKMSKNQLLPVYTNNFGVFTPIFHHVHSYRCRRSVEIGKENLAVLKGYSNSLYERFLKKLHLCIMIFDGHYLFVRNFSFNDRQVKFSLEPDKKLKEELRPFKTGSNYIVGLDSEKVKVFVFCLR